jgi:hypothetical protein
VLHYDPHVARERSPGVVVPAGAAERFAPGDHVALPADDGQLRLRDRLAGVDDGWSRRHGGPPLVAADRRRERRVAEAATLDGRGVRHGPGRVATGIAEP